ncbi:MAG TPA: di-heme oxidoredictase family protein [Pyrinomonadaceae bacterium]
MKFLKLFVFAFFASVLVTSLVLTPAVSSQTEAPALFDNLTNGFTTQAQFDADRAAFEAREEVADGLGPIFNAQSCVECHQNRVSGGVSQIMELRAGHSGPDGSFVPAPGGSLINSRSINTTIQERVPGGPLITYVNNSSLVSLVSFDIDAGVLNNLTGTTGHGFPAYSPDGSRIAFGENGNIWVVNNDGTNPNKISFEGDSHPTWSPDGTKIAFSSTRTGVAQIFTMTPIGTEVTNISNDANGQDRFPTFSPDGTKIAFQRTPTSGLNPVGKIWTMNANGSGQTQITLGTGNDERPTYSPDGLTIAFSTNRDGNYEIYKILAVGGVATRLTNNAASDRNPSWAADNSAIAFGSNRNSGLKIWTIAPDGTNPTQVNGNNDGGGDQPAWSKVSEGETIRTFRASPILVGLGFVECIADGTLLAIRDSQPVAMRGTAIEVDIAEAPDQTRIGRFGWKNSVATLLSFSAGAYLLEMGITSPLFPNEQTSLGRSVAFADTVADPEDTGGELGFGEDVEAFTRFMRSAKAPPRNSAMVLNDATDPGSLLFDSLNCSVCHVRSITTAPVGSVINGGTFVVPAALGNKIIHPFSDFLLHDIGTGDGIVETNGELTRNKIRTAPLWGLRTRDKFMHDGGSSSAPTNSGAQSFTLNEAVLRHAGQATASRTAYQALTPLQRSQLIRFLKSL